MKFHPVSLNRPKHVFQPKNRAKVPENKEGQLVNTNSLLKKRDIIKKKLGVPRDISAYKLARNITRALGLKSDQKLDVIRALRSKTPSESIQSLLTEPQRPKASLLGESRLEKVEIGPWKWEAKPAPKKVPKTAQNEAIEPLSTRSTFEVLPSLSTRSTFDTVNVSMAKSERIAALASKFETPSSSSHTLPIEIPQTSSGKQAHPNFIFSMGKGITFWTNKKSLRSLHKLFSTMQKVTRVRQPTTTRKPVNLPYLEQLFQELDYTYQKETGIAQWARFIPHQNGLSALIDPHNSIIDDILQNFKSYRSNNILLSSSNMDHQAAVLLSLQKRLPGKILEIKKPASTIPSPPPINGLSALETILPASKSSRKGLAFSHPDSVWEDIPNKNPMTLYWMDFVYEHYTELRQKAGLKPLQSPKDDEPLVVHIPNSNYYGLTSIEKQLANKENKDKPVRFILSTMPGGDLHAGTKSPGFTHVHSPSVNSEDWLKAMGRSKTASNFAEHWNIKIESTPAMKKLIQIISESHRGQFNTASQFWTDFDKFGRLLDKDKKLDKKAAPYSITEDDVDKFAEKFYPRWVKRTEVKALIDAKSETTASESDSMSDSEDSKEIKKTVFRPNKGNEGFSKLTKNVAVVEAALEKVYREKKYAARFAFLREKIGDPPRMNFLLDGPPGNGKTSVATAACQSIADTFGQKVTFLKTRGSAISLGAEQGASAGLNNAVTLFEKIKKTKGPIVVLIDEADDLMGEVGNDINQVLGKTMATGTKTLQTEMDDINKDRSHEDRVYFFLATNYRGQIPEAVISRARFHFTFSNPNFEEKKEFFELKLPEKQIQHSEPVVQKLTELTEGKAFSRRDLDDLVEDLQDYLWENESNQTAIGEDPVRVRELLKPTIKDVETVVANFRKKPIEATSTQMKRDIERSHYEYALDHLNNLESTRASAKAKAQRALDELAHIDGELAAAKLRREEAVYRLNTDMRYAIEENDKKRNLRSTHT